MPVLNKFGFPFRNKEESLGVVGISEICGQVVVSALYLIDI